VVRARAVAAGQVLRIVGTVPAPGPREDSRPHWQPECGHRDRDRRKFAGGSLASHSLTYYDQRCRRDYTVTRTVVTVHDHVYYHDDVMIATGPSRATSSKLDSGGLSHYDGQAPSRMTVTGGHCQVDRQGCRSVPSAAAARDSLSVRLSPTQ
jgi:hypothetical protein